MNSKQINALISQLKKINFNYARIKIDNFELEIDRNGDTAQINSDGKVITSPMIGIFHHNEQPTEIGDVVTSQTVIGQIESMKLYNEVVAGEAGRIANVLVEDGQAVEFGQELFELELSEDVTD